MNEIINFVKDIITGNVEDKKPVGLCVFECSENTQTKESGHKFKKEVRLSELMDK